MNYFPARWITAGVFLLAATLPLSAQVNVTTWHNDNSRSGANTHETFLTPSFVSSTNFGEVWAASVDGMVYGQLLVLTNVTIGGGKHNVVYAASEHDSLYALDADTGALYWKKSFISPPSVTTVPSSQHSCSDITPEFGITGTPVIDPSTGTIYLVAATLESGGDVQRLHAIDVGTGAEKFGGPVKISATVPNTGVSFVASEENQRSALALTNGHVVVAFASHCDDSPWWGWLMSYSASTLALEGFFNADYPDAEGGGIWMSGAGPGVDASGNIYVAAGNGDYNGSTELGDSVLKFPPPPTGGKWWAPVDWFTPWNQSTLEANDLDVGSGGVLLLPDLPAGQPHQQRLIQAGKYGWIDVLDRNNMGKYCSTCNPIDTNAVQELQGAISSSGVKGAPTYWNGKIFYGANNDVLKAFSFNTTTGAVSTSAVQQSSYKFSVPGASMSISSNGTSGGIVWAFDNSGPDGGSRALIAYDATNLSNQLLFWYFGTSIKFSVPTIANGKIFFADPNGLFAFGQKPPKPWSGGASQVNVFNNCGVYGAYWSVGVNQAGINSLQWSAGLSGGPYLQSANITSFQVFDSKGTILSVSGGSGTASRLPIGTPSAIVDGNIVFNNPQPGCSMPVNANVGLSD
jgi:hypothetical protein